MVARDEDASDPRLDIRRLPKAELHVHLDGSLRPATMLELAEERGVPLPASEPSSLAESMVVRRGADLDEYLDRFRITLGLMQDAEALRRIAYELVVDHAAERVRYLEVRFCPALATERGLSSGDVLDAVLGGLTGAGDQHGVECRAIVCALRSLPSAHSSEMAELAVAYHDRGVCGFDLAGAEAGNPVRDHLDAFGKVRRAGLPVTVHAGEGSGPESIREALELGGASRIGHGTRLGEDPELLRIVRDRGVPLEVCLTSNLQTGVARSYAAHPLRDFVEEGLRVCLCTDNRLMSGVSLTSEYLHAHDAIGLDWPVLQHLARTGFEAAFVPDAIKSGLLAEFDDAVGSAGSRRDPPRP